MKAKVIKFCHINFDSYRNTLSVWIYGGATKGLRHDCGEKKIDVEQVQKACGIYWAFVDKAVERGLVDDNDQEKLRRFYDDLKTQGAKLAGMVFTEDMRKKIWKHAACSDILVLFTDLLWVPWEALYCGDSDAFLANNCVIARCPKSDREREDIEKAEQVLARARLVFLDPCLDSIRLRCGSQIAQVLRSDGETVYFTRLKSELKARAREARIIYWICEHADDGLRLDKDIFYNVDDCEAHRFPSVLVLFMVSCRSGRGDMGMTGIGARIAERSQCTVIAPSSLVAAQAGVDFVRRINQCLGGCEKLSELWVAMQQSEHKSEGHQHNKNITAGMCYALWYGIYGDCEAQLA